MNGNENILEIISGILTDEQKQALSLALAQKDEPEVPEIPFAQTEEVIDIEKVPVVTIAEAKAIARAKSGRKVTPATTVTEAPFGVEEMVGKNGRTYKYIRTEFDGPITELDEAHLLMKDEFIAFSKEIRNAYSDFCGAGPVAITMYEPQNKHANKEGKVFYRWNGQHTSAKMDELWPLVVPFKEAMTKAVEAIRAKQAEVDQ